MKEKSDLLKKKKLDFQNRKTWSIVFSRHILSHCFISVMFSPIFHIQPKRLNS